MMEWFGELPERWDTKRVGVLFSENTQTNSNLTSESPMQFRFGEIVQKKQTEKDATFLESIKRYVVVAPNDIMVNGLNLNYDFITQRVAIVKERGCMTPAYISLRAKKQINPEYACYLLKTMDGQKLLNGLGTGIRLTLSYNELKKTFLPLPPREEQDQIVRYLDWKVSQINKLINAKKNQIALLQEQKQALINQAVTKGFDPDVEMKDSGVEWIGDIPSWWNICRCKYLFSERNERSEKGAETHLSMSQKYGLVSDEQLDERRMLSESYAGAKLCYANDLVLNRLKAHLGVFAIAPHLGVISPDYTVLQPNAQKILPAFALYVLKSEPCRRELRIRVQGVVEGFWRLYTNDFNTIVLPLPSIDEQQAILDWIGSMAEKMDLSISTIQKGITFLHEYRTRLISDVVTGKLDVRGVAISDYQAVKETTGASDDDTEDLEVGDDS